MNEVEHKLDCEKIDARDSGLLWELHSPNIAGIVRIFLSKVLSELRQ